MDVLVLCHLHGLTFLAMVFFYEETKYSSPLINAVQPVHLRQPTTANDINKTPENDAKKNILQATATNNSMPANGQLGRDWIDRSIPMKSYLERHRLMSNTPGTATQFIKIVFRPFIYLYCFPAVAYVSLQYGCILSLFAVVGNSQAALFSPPPYNFGPVALGLMSIPALIGAIIGSIYGGPLSDWLILILSKRNNGVYEPEFRLYLCLLPAFLGPAGLLLYGLGATAVCFFFHLPIYLLLGAHTNVPCLQGLPWIAPLCGIGLFGFALAAISNLSLVYLYDSYINVRTILSSLLKVTCNNHISKPDPRRRTSSRHSCPQFTCNGHRLRVQPLGDCNGLQEHVHSVRGAGSCIYADGCSDDHLWEDFQGEVC